MAVANISLRRWPEVLAKARANLAEAKEQARRRRCAKHAAAKALLYAWRAYQFEEQVRAMSEPVKKRWQLKQRIVEQELRRLTKFAPP